MKIIPKGNQISSPKKQNSTLCQICTSYIVQYVIKEGVITVFSNWNYLSDLVVVQASTSHYEKLPLLKQMSPKLSRYLISHLEKLSTQKNLQFPLSSKLNLSQNIGSIFSIYHRASRCLYQRGLRFVCRAIGAQQCPMGQWDLYLYEIYMGGPGSIPDGPKFVCEVSYMGFTWVGQAHWAWAQQYS